MSSRLSCGSRHKCFGFEWFFSTLCFSFFAFREVLAIGKFPERLYSLLNAYKEKYPHAARGNPENFLEDQLYLIVGYENAAMGGLLFNNPFTSQGQVRSVIYQLTSGLADLEAHFQGEIRNLNPNNIVIQKV